MAWISSRRWRCCRDPADLFVFIQDLIVSGRHRVCLCCRERVAHRSEPALLFALTLRGFAVDIAAIPAPVKKSQLFELVQRAFAHRGLNSPKARRLRDGQPQAGYLAVFRSDSIGQNRRNLLGPIHTHPLRHGESAKCVRSAGCLKSDIPMTRRQGVRMALSQIGAQRTHDIQMSPRVTSWRVAGLAASIAVVSILRYSTGPASNLPHELSLRLYYIPILVSAYWYGVTGGLIVAAVSSIAYVNRVFGVAPTLDPARLAEVVVFHLFGVAVGLLASAQRRVMDQYRTAATTLQEANTRLRESHEQIRRIDRLKTLGEVAAGLAHEIRHPLASISGALEIIEARSLEGSPEGEFSRLAMAEVQRLDRLVWEFLRYAQSPRSGVPDDATA